MMLLIQYTLVFSSVLLLVALGGCFSERSGIINIGLEGIMVIGALGGVMVLHNLSPQLPGIVILLLTVAASIAAGMIYSLLLAVASINFKADQTLVGTAMNMLGLALATVIAKAYNIATTSGADNSARIAFVENKKALALVEGTEFNWFMILAFAALAVGWVVLYKTRFGLRLMACGEHPQAADSVGINVKKMRYSGVLISGAVGGLGGIAYVTAGVSMCNFEVGVAGFGFLALAVMIFGQWKPLRIGIAALLFGFFRALANVYSGFDFLTALNIPKPVYNMLPYIISLIVLAFIGKHFQHDRAVYIAVMIGTWAAAIFDCMKTLPAAVQASLHLDTLVAFAARYLPLFDKNLGWLLPALIGFAIGLAIHGSKKKKTA